MEAVGLKTVNKEETVTISKAHHLRLLELAPKAYKLAEIAMEVKDWCREPESTAYEAVLALKAEVYRLRASELEHELAEEIESRKRK